MKIFISIIKVMTCDNIFRFAPQILKCLPFEGPRYCRKYTVLLFIVLVHLCPLALSYVILNLI
jgi:hypothetical protein